MKNGVLRSGVVWGLFSLFVGLAGPAGAAGGLAGVREAVGLLVDNQIRARNLLNAHQEAVKNGKLAAFQKEQEERILQGSAQLVVAQRLLNQQPQTTPVADQVKGEAVARRLVEINRQSITLVMRPLDKEGIDQRRKDFNALDDRFDAEVEQLPELVADYALGMGDRRDAVLQHHREEIIAEMLKASGRGGRGEPEIMDPAEYKRKVQALEDKKAAEERYRALRMKEIEERNQQLEAERKKTEAAAAAQPPAPVGPPRDAPQIQAWHRVYLIKIQPFKKALGKVLALDRTRQSKDLALACGELGSTTQHLLVDRGILSRSLELNSAFDKMLREFKAASAHCYAGELLPFEAGLKRGEAALGQLALWLQPYSLSL